LAGCSWVQAPGAPPVPGGAAVSPIRRFEDASGTRGPPKRYPGAAGRRTPPSFAVEETTPSQVRNGHEIL
jgi:hypothetical protein